VYIEALPSQIAEMFTQVSTQHNPSMKGHGEDLCKLLECLLHPNSFGYFLEQHKVDPKAVLCCVETWCKTRLADPTKGELTERDSTA
jgi:hypothetical protein